MLCLVTYDVNEPHHDAVKKRCIDAGFRDFVESPDGTGDIKLPNTTVIIEADSARDAVRKFKEQVTPASLGSVLFGNLIIEKVVGVEFTEAFLEDNVSRRYPITGLMGKGS
jgi:hypothetical protein